MRSLGTLVAGIVGLVSILGAHGALAQGRLLDESGAVLALPIVTDVETGTSTFVVVTNNAVDGRVLHVNLIDGDDWSSLDFACAVTSSETTLFRFTPTPTGLTLRFECTLPSGDPSPQALPVAIRNGIFFVALEDPQTGDTLSSNDLVGSAAIVDFARGLAYDVAAIPFAGIDPAAPGVADRRFRFDNVELAAFAGQVASNFIAPVFVPEPPLLIDAFLILFSLDGQPGAGPGPQIGVDVTFFDDDERNFSASYDFDCFSIVDLLDIDARFLRQNLGSASGHLILTPQARAQQNLAHDALADGGAGSDGVRRPPVLGWIVQTLLGDGDSLAFARTLGPSTSPAVPTPGDVTVFDVDASPLPPPTASAAVLSLASTAIELGLLEGASQGGGMSAEASLAVFAWSLAHMNFFVEREKPKPACALARGVARRSDGKKGPRDLVAGPAREQLEGLLDDLQASLGCPGKKKDKKKDKKK